MFTGPNIVTEGLILALDAGNKKSYPGSGTTWTDLSGQGNNGTLTNMSATPLDSGNGGSLVFDGSNDYVAVSNIGYSNHTIEGWFNSNNGTQGGAAFATICSMFGNYDGGSSKYSMIGLIPNLTFRIDDGATSFTEVTTVSYSANTWYYVALTYSTTSGGTRAYVNGSDVGGITYTTGVTFNSIPLNIAKTQANTYFDGKIASTRIYNRALTAQEVQQNYNATKSRFGLT